MQLLLTLKVPREKKRSI